jgi:hypothetical protein
VKIEDGKSIEVPVWGIVYLVHRTGCAETVAVETTSANARVLIDFIALSSDCHGAKSRNVNYVPDACCYGLKARELVVFLEGTIGIEPGQLGLDDRREKPAIAPPILWPRGVRQRAAGTLDDGAGRPPRPGTSDT